MRIEARIADAAAARGMAPAIEGEHGERISYAALGAGVDALGRALAGLGARPGERVALVLENGPTVPGALLATLGCGACAVPLNARIADAELDRILAHAAPRLVLFPGAREASSHAARHARRLGAGDFPGEALPGAALLGRDPGAAPPPPDDVALLLYTSGSTGAAKGVMLTHANIDFLLAAGLAQGWMRPADRVLAVLPMSHSFGLTSVTLSALAAGACLLPFARFDAARVAAAIRGGGVTTFLGVPAMYAQLAEHAASHAMALRPNALRLAYIGGAPLDPTQKSEYEAMLGLHLAGGYGLTEAAPTVTRTLAADARAGVTLGTPIDGVALEIRDAESGAALPAGEVGVVHVRGPNVMRGYYRDPQATAQAIDAAGWLDTGDYGCLDDEGRLVIAGRRKELIIRSGFNVHPQEVEQAMLAHPAVAAAAVLGRANRGNEDIVAFVMMRPGESLDMHALRSHLAPRIASYKMPGILIVRDALPLLANGKVDKQALRRDLDGGR
ncbi:MAG: AMP-binding protein [Burkholderiales bacterium]|nr:AMP-binding protein [Burkholderiales bacterium]